MRIRKVPNREQQMTIEELMTSEEQPATVEGLTGDGDGSELPEGWTTQHGEAIFSLIRGVSYDKKDVRSEPGEGLVPILRANNIQAGRIESDDLVFVPKSYVSPQQYLQPGDLLIATSSGSRDVVGKTALATNEYGAFAFGAFCAVARPKSRDAAPWLFYYTRSRAYRAYVESVALGININNFRSRDLTVMPILLPPPAEQRRIVATLDRLFARSKRARAELERVPRLVERMKQAVLAAAFRGELTADWRMSIGLEPSIEVRLEMTEPYYMSFDAPSSWEENSVDGMCKIIGGSQPPKAIFKYHEEPGYIRLIQIRDYKTDAFKTYIPTDTAKRFCTASDVMIGRYGPPIFQILRGLEGAYNVALMKAEPKEECLKDFLFWRLQDPYLIKYVEIGSDRTAGQDGVNKSHLLKYPIFLPSPEEQAEIVRRIEAAFARIDAMAAEAARATALLDRLDQATLAVAFRGEL